MKSLQLGKPMVVDIELSDAVPTDAETEADFKALTAVTSVSAQDIKRLKALGLHVKRQGVLETQRGVLLVTQMWLFGITSQLHRMMMAELQAERPDTDRACKVGELLTKFFGKQGELSAVMLGREPLNHNGHEPSPAPPNTAFQAGAVVVGPGGNAHVHVHQNPPAEKGVAPLAHGS